MNTQNHWAALGTLDYAIAVPEVTHLQSSTFHSILTCSGLTTKRASQRTIAMI